MTDQVTKQLDEILVEFFNQAEEDAHSDNFKDGVLITKSHTEAKQSILDLFIKLVEEQKTKIYNSNSRTTGIREEYIDRQALINSIKGDK